MKKIYSYVLMAAMLLIGTSAWAADVPFSGTNRAALQAAIDGAASGTTLVFQENVTLDGPIWLGTANLDDASKSITLDLKGHNVSMTGTSSSTSYYMFVLTHGELLIRNSSATTSLIQLTGQSHYNTQICTVYGSYKSSRWNADGDALNPDSINTRVNGYFSHLEIGERVKIVAGANCLGSGIVVDQLNNGDSPAHLAAKTATNTTPIKVNNTNSPITYFTNIHGGYGYAHGARVDVYGDIEIIGISSGSNKAYGIKTNGNLDAPGLEKAISLKATTDVMNTTSNNYLKNYTPALHALDTLDAAYVYVHNSAKLVTNNGSTKSAAVYASGYAKWLIEGTCEGNVGAYVSSGAVTFNDANVASTATTYTPPTGGNGVSGAGTGVVINSRDGYAGDTEVTISGNTTIEAEAGYGIEEAVSTKEGDTKVETVVITGGTISGGDEGTIVVTEKTAGNETTTIAITGATIEVDPEDPEESVKIGSETLTEFLETQSESNETHITYVENADGSTTLVVSEGGKPDGIEKVSTAAEDASINWKHLDASVDAMSDALTSDMTLTELEINQNYAQTLTIPEGKTLTVGRVVLGPNAKIIVEAGAEFIVSGTQGISTSSDNCIVIENTETTQGTFLLNPAVTSNTQPRATVNMNVKYAGKDGDDYAWHRFAMPVKALAAAWTKAPNYGTYLYGWDYSANDWAAVAGGSTSMVPWQGYTLTYNEAYNEAEIVVYTFKGQLLGNVDAALNFQKEGFNFFGNSYTGYMDALTLVEGLVGSKVRGTIYMWNEAEQNYSAVTLNRLRKGGAYVEDYEKEVASMQTFILQLAGADAANEEVDYASAVWGNPRYGLVPTPAPARRAAEVNDDEAFLKIVVTAENGKSDNVIFTKNSSLSDAYDDGYDAVKYMNANRMNMYSTVDGQDYASVASDNLIGKKLSINTSNDVNYTMSFKVVDGAEYAIRDNVTNKVITIAEGNTYTFAAQPNTKIDGRFEIVGVESVITAIENTEANNEVRGIYTLLGQYVGEDFNALPAGVYIVNGVKVVK